MVLLSHKKYMGVLLMDRDLKLLQFIYLFNNADEESKTCVEKLLRKQLLFLEFQELLSHIDQITP